MAEFTVKDAATVRDDILRTIRNGLIARGVANPQLGPGSLEFVNATAVANEIAVANSNVQIKADAQMPDTAIESDLDRLTAMFGLARRVASSSVGYVTLSTSANTYIPVGAQLVDQSGIRYEVTVGGTYTNTSPTNLVPIQSIDEGAKTNHVEDDVLRWTSTPPYAQPTALVTAAGLTGGLDAEGDEDLRARLFSRLQNPPNNCNWNQIAAIAEEIHTSVQKAYIYPAANGPSTVHIALAQAPQVLSASLTALTSTSKNRDIDALNGLATGPIMLGTVVPYIQGQLPEYVESVITSVTNVPNDVSIALSLPASPAAVPSGPGGGWIDGSPWPDFTGSLSATKCSVTAVTSTIEFTVDAPTAPYDNVTHICWLSPVDWVLYRAKVLATTTGTTGAYVIHLDTPFPGIAVGDYIWPDCTNAQTYVDAILTAFGQMGPGEKTTANITRGYRHPVPVNSWPHTLGATQLRAISNSGDEVLDVSYLYRTSSAAPAVPGAVATSPNIYVPRRIGFYRLV